MALVVAANAFATVAFASSGLTPAAENVADNSVNGAYSEGMVGGADRHDFFTAVSGNVLPEVNAANWTWALGFDAGYQFDHNLIL